MLLMRKMNPPEPGNFTIGFGSPPDEETQKRVIGEWAQNSRCVWKSLQQQMRRTAQKVARSWAYHRFWNVLHDMHHRVLCIVIATRLKKRMWYWHWRADTARWRNPKSLLSLSQWFPKPEPSIKPKPKPQPWLKVYAKRKLKPESVCLTACAKELP